MKKLPRVRFAPVRLLVCLSVGLTMSVLSLTTPTASDAACQNTACGGGNCSVSIHWQTSGTGYVKVIANQAHCVIATNSTNSATIGPKLASQSEGPLMIGRTSMATSPQCDLRFYLGGIAPSMLAFNCVIDASDGLPVELLQFGVE